MDSKEPALIKAVEENCQNNLTLRLWVPSEQMGLIIGQGGATIKTICKQTSTNIKVGKSTEESTWAPLLIAGSPLGAKNACDLISEKVEEIDDIVAEFKIDRTKHSTVIGPKVSLPFIELTDATMLTTFRCWPVGKHYP